MSNSTTNSKKGAKSKKLISQRAFAKMLGITTTTLAKHIKTGKMDLVEGKVDPVLAKKQLAKNIDMTHGRTKLKIGGKKTEEAKNDRQNDGATFSKAKAFKEGYKAKLAELEYKEKIKEYVKAVDVESAAFNMARKIRDQLLNIPDRVQAEFAALTGRKSEEVRTILLREIQTAIEGV
ncbi:MAG: hypothetical protein D8M57_13180 [Candidatus Scalindua sp. AMX11]|nr:MAG: hypothetical protein DWQ00_11910 [Candidatus Scalindua sp.]NOG83773.1 hypothetical protein [Planctomycetota bacterium]RZV82930.1 MAG: hypothetical protein EX341_09065 [Candidatus Scalindua sp. SCAELEC01]TDE64448.1 MAG: hypothetical protein D8M57_13180 [Candidatus Scalindua sp. AMX11]GJQ59775.1 MAG: hypothetical protein SCALA701_25760 [Candidatus Scalindua sp.]